MHAVESRITSKGQVSIPAAVRRRLDLQPGSRIEWAEEGGEIVVRRASRFTSAEIHEAVFDTPPKRASAAAMDAGVRAHLKKKHARR